MKPEIPSQSFNYEQPSGANEIIGGEVVEKDIDSSAEYYESSDKTKAAVNDSVSTIMLPTPVAADSNDDVITTIGSVPLVANDDDLIEKEWVDKAKKIIAETHNNPHQREQSISELQVVYLKKRYGKELGVTE